MRNNVQALRQQRNLTQTELGERSGLALRTIQRIEAGAALKGFTLRALAKALDSLPEDLLPTATYETDMSRAKMINISALAFLVLPFGNIIIPSLLISKTDDQKAKTLGKEILSVQILWTAGTGLAMVASPFVQQAFSLKTPVFLLSLVALMGVNVFVILKNNASLSRQARLSIRLKNSWL
jgi:transcriptional regulator with XRE-family HTH domain